MDGERMLQGKTLAQWKREIPLLSVVMRAEEVAWLNERKLPFAQATANCPYSMREIQDASDRLDRFADYFCAAFPETRASGGILESPLCQIPRMHAALAQSEGGVAKGGLWLKLDSLLPISGSIKARGGIYEVLKIAEDIAREEGLLQADTPYRAFDTEPFRRVFSRYAIAVGSTGNLGLSIGVVGAKLGFQTTVHMSADARQWKKDRLRESGVTVVEYASDYSEAVSRGREQAKNDPLCRFVDDENSQTLFFGYSVAALRLRRQLAQNGVLVDETHPLFVYLPCGVGGGPGGVAFGLKMVFGDAVHCFFAEPTHACCMLLGLATGLHNGISMRDIGVDGGTIADGLAVGRASGFVGRLLQPFLDGCYSLSDERMLRYLAMLADTEGLLLEPSALAGIYGPVLMQQDPVYRRHFERVCQATRPEDATHLVWATGGGMVPKEEMARYVEAGRRAKQG